MCNYSLLLLVVIFELKVYNMKCLSKTGGINEMGLVKFDVISLMMNPFVLMFVTIALGLLFGKIKFGKFSF